jgi:hypothetical protein
MINPYSFTNFLDILCENAKSSGFSYLFFYNPYFAKLQQDKKEKILKYYKEHLPEEVYYAIKQEFQNVLKYVSADSAIADASSWFPAVDYLPDSDYYWHCYVISPEGDFEYENIVVKPEPVQ